MKSLQLKEYLEIAIDAVTKAKSVAAYYLDNPQVITDEFKDIKTIADLKINDAIIAHLQPLGIPIVSEESVENADDLPELCWIIDPLDGTYNFTRGFDYAGISVALFKGGESILGVVGEIFNDNLYISSADQGALMNDEHINVSKVSSIKDATLATGFPSGASYETDDLLNFVRRIQDFKKIRAIGAASIMLAKVAKGVFDVYYEKDIYLWDVAAGLSLVKEAGGAYYIQKRPGTFKYEVLATNAALYQQAKTSLIN